MGGPVSHRALPTPSGRQRGGGKGEARTTGRPQTGGPKPPRAPLSPEARNLPGQRGPALPRPSPGRTRSPPHRPRSPQRRPAEPPPTAQLSSGAIPAPRPTLRPEQGGESEEPRRLLSPAVPSSLPAAEPRERRRSCRGPPVPAAAARSPPARRPHTDNMAEAQGSAASRRDQSEARRKRKPHHPLARDVPREGGEVGRICARARAGSAPQRILGAVVRS